MQITVLAGGIGAARFLRGLLADLSTRHDEAAGADVTVIGNTADDITLFGLRVCPDLDTVMYTLGGGIHEEQGWGRADESFTLRDELRAYDVPPDWFTLGDRDFATHIVRTQLLRTGWPLSDITAALCRRWEPGVHLLPMSDDPIETHVVVDDQEGGRRAVHFQEWWVRLHAEPEAREFVFLGAAESRPAPGVVEALDSADMVLVAPSNPVVSIGPLMAVPGIRDALRRTGAPVVGVSPIIGGAPVRGMADACLRAIGVETSAAAVAVHYGARAADGLLDGWLVSDDDAAVPAPPGVAQRGRPLLMTDEAAASALAGAAVDLALELRAAPLVQRP